jgi:hypothetical protein
MYRALPFSYFKKNQNESIGLPQAQVQPAGNAKNAEGSALGFQP